MVALIVTCTKTCAALGTLLNHGSVDRQCSSVKICWRSSTSLFGCFQVTTVTCGNPWFSIRPPVTHGSINRLTKEDPGPGLQVDSKALAYVARWDSRLAGRPPRSLTTDDPQMRQTPTTRPPRTAERNRTQ